MQALASWYPDIEIFPWMFQENAPYQFWKHEKNRKKFFDWLMTELGYKCMEDWYTITQEDIQKNGGVGLLKYYNNSPSKALQSVYSEHNWELDRFKTKPSNYWKSKENQQKCFDSLMTRLGFKGMEDWYNVTFEDIHKNGGGVPLKYYNSSPSSALENIYPEHNWEMERFKNKPKHNKAESVA